MNYKRTTVDVTLTFFLGAAFFLVAVFLTVFFLGAAFFLGA